MFYPDLYNECQIGRGPRLRAIGWLAKDQPFPTGEVAGLAENLDQHLGAADRWLPFISCGVHFCDFCRGAQRHGGAQCLVVPGKDCVYVAPELIAHYVRAHHYRPPEEFVAAIIACPPQGSKEYMALLMPYLGYFGR